MSKSYIHFHASIAIANLSIYKFLSLADSITDDDDRITLLVFMYDIFLAESEYKQFILDMAKELLLMDEYKLTVSKNFNKIASKDS